MNKKTICLVFVLLNAYSLNFAAPGVTGGQIFAYNPDPATTAMGDAGSALLSDKACAAILNPAATIGSYRIVASVSDSPIFNGIQYNYLGAQFPTTIGNFGFSFMYAGFGNIDYFDNAGNPIYMGRTNDMGYILNYSVRLKKTIPFEVVYGGIGVNVKMLRSSLGNYAAEAFAVDVGGVLIIPHTQNLLIGAVCKNLGPTIKFVSQDNNLPQSLVFGAAYQGDDFYKLRVALDYNAQTYSADFLSAGVSISPMSFLSLRAGVKLAEKLLNADVRMGFGFEFQSLMIDYSYTPRQNLEGTHNINLSCAIGGFSAQKTAYDYYMRNHFREAVEFYRRKDFIVARRKFEEILSVYPEHVPSKKYLKKIIDELIVVDAYNANIINEYMKRGDKAFNRGNIVDARKNFERVLKLDPENMPAKRGIEKVEKYARTAVLESERKKNAERIRHLWDRAQKFYKEGDLIHAKEAFNFILDIDPENKNAKNELTNINNQLAKIASDKVAEIYNRGLVLFDEGKFKEAIAYFETVAIAAPQRTDARELIRRAEENIRKRAQYERAQKIAAMQNKIRPELVKMFEKSLSYYKKNNLEAAVRSFKRTKELADKYFLADYSENAQKYIAMINADLSDIHYKKGFELYVKNKFEDAVKEYRTAIKYNPENTSVVLEHNRLAGDIAQKYYENAMASYSLGDFVKARELLKIALIYKPDKTEAKKALEKIQ